MSNMTADIEQLLIELVRITTNIAALINATNTNASDGSDSLTSNANRLSLSAAIIAVAAFFIASLQAILEYSSAGESARHKCSVAAIGPFSEYVVKKWSFRHWRWKFYYPVLNPELFATYPREPPSPTRWELVLPGPALDSHPRATWVQLMSSGNAVGKDFIMSSIHLDVDSIPGSLDVPPQIIDLVALGKVVVYLGCDSVNISVQNRNFEAVGEFGSITTEELIGFGKVVRFQRYDHVPYHTLAAPYRLWYQHASHLVEGIFNTDAYKVQEQLDSPKSLQYVSKDLSSIFMRNEASHMTSNLKEALQKEDSNICPSGVNMMSDTNPQAAFTRWQSSLTPVFKDTKFPSILVTLAVAVFPCTVNGFPARSLLQPFLIQCRQISQALYEHCEQPFPHIPNDHNTNRQGLNLHEIIRKELTMSAILDASTTSIRTRDAAEGVKQDFNAELDLLLVKEPIPKLALGERLLRAWRMILAPIADLIKSFDPHSWAQSFREKVRYSEYKYLICAGGDAPLGILKMHIVLVDIQIHHLLSIMHRTYAPQMQFAKHENLKKEHGYFWGLLSPRGTFIFHVRAAILKSLSDASLVGSRLFDNFGPALLSEINIPTATTEYEKQTREVGDLLAFRIVLYAACLLIVPDTSDILETQLSVGRRGFVLPMI
ncbi:hypothetical protein F4860DRAFT_202763 [Xylaria cubensis]|nr:hypothetical protein F4860DRAFT_202763 [Xylaria cubensis]